MAPITDLRAPGSNEKICLKQVALFSFLNAPTIVFTNKAISSNSIHLLPGDHGVHRESIVAFGQLRAQHRNARPACVHLRDCFSHCGRCTSNIICEGALQNRKWRGVSPTGTLFFSVLRRFHFKSFVFVGTFLGCAVVFGHVAVSGQTFPHTNNCPCGFCWTSTEEQE